MKKNIAIVITRLDLGGAQKIALFLAKNLNRKKYNVFFITGSGGILDDEAKKIKDINLIFLNTLKHPIHPFFDIITIFKLKQIFKKENIEIVHTHSSKAGILGRIAAYLAGVKLKIHTIHGFPFHEYQNFFIYKLYLYLERFTAKFTDKLVAVGKNIIKYGLKNKVGKKEQYVLIYPGIELKKFSHKKNVRKNFLKKYGLNPEKFTVGMIGNLKKQKNPIEFLNIAKKVLDIDNTIQFIFAGDGYLKEKVNKLLKKYELEKNVKFIGWINETDDFINSIDLFLLTSLWEGLPCSLIEAISNGKNILVSDIPSNKEVVDIFKTGKTYKVGDYSDAAHKILSYKNKKIKVKNKYFKEKIKKFNFLYMLKNYEKIYKNVNI